ncbi:hypothetical protein GCM10020331_069650 [Ectobacillus funiculus]
MYLQGINLAPVAAWLGEAGLWLFGAWDESLKVLCVLVIIDYFTGFAKGVVLGKSIAQDWVEGNFFKKSTSIYCNYC